jgi:hypothetical protein
VQRSPGNLSLLEAAVDALLDAKKERPAGLKIFRPFS